MYRFGLLDSTSGTVNNGTVNVNSIGGYRTCPVTLVSAFAMKIMSIESELVTEIPFLNAGRGPEDFYRDSLPVHRGYVDTLPAGTSAIVVTSDLQGRETFQSACGNPQRPEQEKGVRTLSGASHKRGRTPFSRPHLRLLGEVVPGLLRNDVIPTLGRLSGEIGVLLAGDFYTVPALEKRGGSGDVRPVWDRFAAEFDWVVGVAGNHDTFGTDSSRPRFTAPVYFLDNDNVDIGGTTIAGLSGILGNPRRPWRRTEEDYADSLAWLLCDQPAITLLHDGPDVPGHGFKGSPRIREVFEQFENTLVVRGHSHWQQPLAELSCGTQILNVDARVVILTEPKR